MSAPCKCATQHCADIPREHDGHCCIRDDAATCHKAEYVAAHLASPCDWPHDALRTESPTAGKEPTS